MSAILVNTITNRDGSNGPVITGITTIGIITSNASIGSTDIFVEQIVFGQTGILTAAVSMGTTDLYVSGNTYGNLVGNVTGDVTGTADFATYADTAGVSTNVTVADESSDTTCFPLFTTAATGNLAPKSGSNLTFNSSTGNLGATIFTGSGSGITGLTNSNLSGSAGITNANLANSTISGISLGSNLGTLTMGVSGNGLSGSDTYDGSAGSTFTVTSNATNSNTASTIVFRDGSGNFSAGTITASLSGNATSATSATSATTATNANNINLADESSDTTCFPVFATAATGNQAPKTGSNLTFNSSTGNLGATIVEADTRIKVGSATTSTSLYVVGNSAGSVVSYASSQSSSFALDFSEGNNFAFDISGNITLNNPTGVTTGQSGTIVITQDPVGSRTLAYGANWAFVDGTAPTISTGAGTTSVLLYYAVSPTEIVTSSLLGVS